jgi:hypothetical protein
MATQFYAYRPLRNECGIRVLLLEPALDYDAPLSAGLQHIQITKSTQDGRVPPYENATAMASSSSLLDTTQIKYEAISYAWGDQKSTSTLRVTATTPSEFFKISPSVDTMLRYLRLPNQQRHLWIDALCINQDDLSEKDGQVRFMGDIYRQAQAIIIWVGPPTEAYQDVTRFFEDMVKYGNADSRHFEERAATWDKLREFLSKKWFTRRWTIQEAVLARQATIVCGKHRINFMVFAKHACLMAQGQSHIKPSLAGILGKLGMMYRLRGAALTEVRSDPLSLFVDFSTAECSNEHDRIYALNALSTLPAPVSYKTSLKNVYILYTKMHVDCGNLAILNCAGAFRSHNPTMPSWVPDWRHIPIYTPFATQLPTQGQIGQKRKCLELFNIQDATEKPVLTMTGTKLSTVSYVGTKAPCPIWGGDLLQLLQDWYQIFGANSDKYAHRSNDIITPANQFISTITLGTVVMRSNALSPDHPWLRDAHAENTPGISSTLAHLIHEAREMHSEALWTSRTDALTNADFQAKISEHAKLMDSEAEAINVQVRTIRSLHNVSTLASQSSMQTQSSHDDVPQALCPQPKDVKTMASEISEGLKGILKSLTYSSSEMQLGLRLSANPLWGLGIDVNSGKNLRGRPLEPSQLVEVLCRATAGRTCFWSSEGLFGLGPANMEPGDIIVAIPACPTPYVLRPISTNSTTSVKSSRSWLKKFGKAKDDSASLEEYTLVGDCYVHGFEPDKVTERERSLCQFRVV